MLLNAAGDVDVELATGRRLEAGLTSVRCGAGDNALFNIVTLECIIGGAD